MLSIIYMGIYACKRLYFCTNSPKYDLIMLNKYAQNHQLHTNSTLDGVIAFTMGVANLKYSSYVTATLYK